MVNSPQTPWPSPERPPLERVEALRSLSLLIVDIGTPCWATGPTAGALHRFDGRALQPPFHVLLMRGRNVRRIGHVIHTTSYLPEIHRKEVFGVPCLSPTRALISVAGSLVDEPLTAALDGALRDGRATEDFLHRRIHEVRAKGRHGIPELLEVMEGREITCGGHSWLEREFLRLVHESGIPRPSTQQVLSRRDRRLMRVDFAWPGTPVVVETLGYRWHRTGAQMASADERMNRLVLERQAGRQAGRQNGRAHPDRSGSVSTMAVTVRIPTTMRPISGGSSTVQVEGATLGDVLTALEAAHPGFHERLFDDAGGLRKFVNVFVSDDDVRYLDGLGTATPDGTTVSIIPAVAGG